MSLLEKPYVTELDLTHSLIPEEIVEQLVQTMPAHKGPDLQEDRDLPKYDYVSFMERYLHGEKERERVLQQEQPSVNGKHE